MLWLNKLAGYLKILGKQRLTQILLSTAHLKKLLLTFVYISELDCSNVTLLEDVTAISMLKHFSLKNRLMIACLIFLLNLDFEETMYHGISRTWKNFKFLSDSATINKLKSIIKIVGEYGDQKTLTDSILKMIYDVPKFRKELTMVLNVFLEGIILLFISSQKIKYLIQ